jgi:hypothetical protein
MMSAPETYTGWISYAEIAERSCWTEARAIFNVMVPFQLLINPLTLTASHPRAKNFYRLVQLYLKAVARERESLEGSYSG